MLYADKLSKRLRLVTETRGQAQRDSDSTPGVNSIYKVVCPISWLRHS